MSPENVTPESVAKLRDDINVIASRGLRGMLPHEETLNLLDALESAWKERDALRAKVDVLISNGSTAAFDKISDHFGESERENVALRAEVQRLTEEARRSDAGRVEVPELTDTILDLACGPDLSGKADLHSAAFRDLSRMQYRRGWEDLSSRLSPSPQPATGAMGADGLLPCPFCGKAPEIEPKDPERLGDAWATVFCPDEDCPGNPGAYVENEDGHLASVSEASRIWNRRATSPQPSADVVVVPREEWEAAEFVLRAWNGGWREDRMISPFYAWNEIRKESALRSSTNHDSKETP